MLMFHVNKRPQLEPLSPQKWNKKPPPGIKGVTESDVCHVDLVQIASEKQNGMFLLIE